MSVILPLGGLEFVLLAVLLVFAGLVIRTVRRRNSFAFPTASDLLPQLATETRLTSKLRRVWRDPSLALPLVEILVGKRLLLFCPTDHEAKQRAYKEKIGKSVTIAPFGLATLQSGGADTIREQIRDADTVELTPDLLRFLHVGQAPNDYFAIGRVLSSRDDTWEGDALTVYRLQAAPDLTLEVATPKTETVFSDGSMAHGSVRLFGYLAE